MRIVVVLALAGFVCGVAHADDLNCSQIKLVAPFGAGGSADVATRFIAQRLEGILHKSTLIENRPGATGNIGTVAVASAPADGCTLLVNGTAIATFPYSFAKLGYDPFMDVAPVGSIGATPNVLVGGRRFLRTMLMAW
jgi:tripartite-type tricarboxylate transporter receptor subunit TctC